jgi:hypothetical protein
MMQINGSVVLIELYQPGHRSRHLSVMGPLSPNSGNSPPADGVFKKPVEVGTTMMYGQCSAIVENFARGIR